MVKALASGNNQTQVGQKADSICGDRSATTYQMRGWLVGTEHERAIAGEEGIEIRRLSRNGIWVR